MAQSESPEINDEQTQSSQRVRERKIWVTILLGLLDPGLPLIYCGNLGGGIILAIGFAILSAALFSLAIISLTFFIAGLLAILILFILILIYNIRYTIKANSEHFAWLNKTWLLIIVVLIGSWVFSGIIDSFREGKIVDTYKIPAVSMANTLYENDFLIASKAIDRNTLKIGDLVIFRYPKDKDQRYIKRIAALPGDRIKIVDKQVFVNGQLSPLPPQGIHIDSTRIYPHYNDGSWGPANRDNMPEIAVPAGMVFVLGDNRDNSNDSRFWGFLNIDDILGKPLYIYLSWDKESSSIRWNRIGTRLDI